MYDRILVRYGDLMLKGRNKKHFIKTAVERVKEKVTSEKVAFETAHDRLYIRLNGERAEDVMADLDKVSGLSSYSPVAKSEKDMEAIQQTALMLLEKTLKGPTTFKVETKRADKTYPLTSQEISQKLGAKLLPAFDDLSADMHNPDLLLTVELRSDAAYLFAEKVQGLGGFPVGTMGKGMAMLSGGIDSGVAAYLAMRKGIEIELIHFESTPLTPIESAQKVVDIAKKLAAYGAHNQVSLHFFPMRPIHEAILEYVPESYHITILRRMMMRISQRAAKRRKIFLLVNGESVGQVASQTLASLFVSDRAVSVPIIRPLATYDKNEIVDIAVKIGTYKIAIRPFEDCCQIYVPKSPATNPRDYYARRYENLFDYNTMIEEGLDKMKTLELGETSEIDLTASGFTVEEALSDKE